MKIEIYNDKIEEEKVMRLKLVQSGNIVTLTLVDKNGEFIPRGNILSIDNTGVMWRCTEINTYYFQTDDKRKIKEVSND